jgi:hypothetical protein
MRKLAGFMHKLARETEAVGGFRGRHPMEIKRAADAASAALEGFQRSSNVSGQSFWMLGEYDRIILGDLF